jgi:hypothetical protein
VSKKLKFLSIGEYPASFYQTPQNVKDELYELQYRILLGEQPFKWQDQETGQVKTDDPWPEDQLRSFAIGLVQARLGWARPGVTVKLDVKDYEKVRAAERRAAKKARQGKTEPELA